MPIKLVDLLKIDSSDYKDYKIHFAIGADKKSLPKEEFINGNFEEWQNDQNNKNFNRKYVISLIWVDDDKWLFAGVYQVDGEPKPHNTGYKYSMHITDNQKDLVGRLILYYKKEYRASYPNLELEPSKGTAPSYMYVSSILENRLSIDDFPGFNAVDISWKTLETIINKKTSTWYNALSKAKGVYLIRDTKTGKMYVGSAYGDECIWSRWKEYAINGHGGNVELKELLSQEGKDYTIHFRYSILEVCNMNLGSEYIIERESYWKEILMTREFGYNKN